MSVSRRGQWNQCLLMRSRNIHFLPFREAMEQRNPKPLGGITLGLYRPGPRRLATVAPGLRTLSLRRHLRVMTRRPRRGQRPHAGWAFRPPGAGLQAPKGPGADPARMRATPTAFRLRVFPEPPPLFLGFRSTPLSISWRVPAGWAGNLCPVISQKTMTGAPLDRRLYRRKQTLPQGVRLPPGDPSGPGPHAGLGRPGLQEACGRCRISPGLSAAHSREAANSSRRETCLGSGRRLSFLRRRCPQRPPPGPALTFFHWERWRR